jgi:hypothetical protein
MKSGLLLTAAMAAVLLAGANSARAAWDFTTISDPAGVSTNAMGINDAGVVVGGSTDSGGNSSGFSLTGATFTPVDVPGAAMTTASGINNAGVITGYYQNAFGVHGFTQTGATATPFDEPNAATGGKTYGSATNAAGTTVGYYFDNALALHGFSVTTGTYTSLDVTGLGSVVSTQALGINAAGTIVGSYSDGTQEHGFVDVGGNYTAVNAPNGSKGTVVTSIDSVGDLGGYYIDGGGTTHGFVDVDGTFYTVDDPNAGTVTEIAGFNSVGQVVGYYVANSDDVFGFTADVTEPRTLAMFGLATLGMLGLRRGRSFGF